MKYPPLYTSYFIFLSRAIFKCRYLSPYIRWKTINVATWPWMFENIRGQQSSTRFFFSIVSIVIDYVRIIDPAAATIKTIETIAACSTCCYNTDVINRMFEGRFEDTRWPKKTRILFYYTRTRLSLNTI